MRLKNSKVKMIALVVVIILLFQIIMPILPFEVLAVDETEITFPDTNLYNAITEVLSDKIDEKDDENQVVMISNENLEMIETLQLNNKNIQNLSGIEKFVNLKNLELYDNKIEDITPILMNTKLEVLNIGYNKIKSLEGIENLTNLIELQAQGNQIDEIPELSNIQTDKLKIAQSYTRTSINMMQGKNEIELPQAFIQAQQDLNRYYARGAFELENCEWSEDRTKIVVDANTIAMTNAKITITSGILKGTELFVYGVGIAYYIDNTQMELENTDLDINQDGEITLADAELMKKYVDKDMADLTQEQIGRILKVDVNYDDEIDDVDYNRFVKYINKETDILFTVMTDTSFPVSHDIIAQIYTLNPNIITNDEMYIFTENGEHEMSFIDETGRQNILIASVNCIDKEAPSYEITYSPADFTKDNVTVTITAYETIYIDEEYEDEYGEIQTTGWTVSEDKMTVTKTYTENTTEEVLLVDEAGNSTIVEVVVNNIFANAPSSGSLILKEQNSLGEIYTSNTWTNQNVYIAIDESNRPANTTMSYEINGQGPYTASQTITQEGIYEIVLTTTDDIGNSTKVNYQVKIDKTKPEIGTLHLREESSIGNELENEVITNKNVYVSLEKGTDNLSGIAQSYYVLNGDETNQITDSEIYRADGEYPLKVISIDRAGNQSEKTYRFIISKQAPILRQEQELQADGTLKVKIISDKQLDDSLKVEGWNLSPNKLELTKIYYIDKTETVTVKDLLGNTATITIEVTGITAIDFLVDVTYSTKELTNQDVTVTITSVTPMKAISGWTLQNQYKQTKKFSSNTTQNITIESTTGKTIQETISITNIDKMAPSVSVDYSTQEMTNNDVTVTVVADEEIEPVNGWILSGRNTLQKTFSQNSTEIITIKDLAGNTTTQTIQVNNIDKVAPIVEVTYSPKEETYEPVVVTITTNEAVKGINGWETVNTNTLQKTFSQNGTEIIDIEDLVGNTKSVTIRISNIKQKQEIKDDIYEITQDKYILGIKPNTKWEDCLRDLGGITLSETKTGIVKTGDQIKVNNITYTLIVVGDITKDGNFDLQDLSNLLFHISNIKELNGEKLKAADMNLDKEVDTIDLSNMCIKLTNLE